MPKPRALTESERNTIVNGLRVAAERFKGHVQTLKMTRCPKCLDVPGKDGRGRVCKGCNGAGEIPDTAEAHVRLAKQFESQYSDSIMLAELIENADEITLTEGQHDE